MLAWAVYLAMGEQAIEELIAMQMAISEPVVAKRGQPKTLAVTDVIVAFLTVAMPVLL